MFSGSVVPCLEHMKELAGYEELENNLRQGFKSIETSYKDIFSNSVVPCSEIYGRAHRMQRGKE